MVDSGGEGNSRNRMNVDCNIIKHIEERRLVWYGHPRRASMQIRMVTDWSPMDRGKRGKPRRSWLNEVDETMEARIGNTDGDGKPGRKKEDGEYCKILNILLQIN